MPQHILIVEDDEALRQLYGICLEREHYTCTLVGFASEALEVLSAGDVDLMLTDVNLGEKMSGFDLVKQIRQSTDYDTLKILVITSFPDRFQDTADLNISGILKKPIHYTNLVQAVKDALTLTDDS